MFVLFDCVCLCGSASLQSETTGKNVFSSSKCNQTFWSCSRCSTERRRLNTAHNWILYTFLAKSLAKIKIILPKIDVPQLRKYPPIESREMSHKLVHLWKKHGLSCWDQNIFVTFGEKTIGWNTYFTHWYMGSYGIQDWKRNLSVDVSYLDATLQCHSTFACHFS